MSFIFEDAPPKKVENSLWVEKYRPVILSEYIGDAQLKETIQSFIDKKDIPHLLFYGTAGGGKTTLAKMIAKNILCDVIYINASDETGVDNVRGKIKGYASTSGFNKLKVAILDECLDENTLVWVLKSGIETSIKIKDLIDGEDLVKSYNISKNKIEWRPFYLWDMGDKECVEIELENGELVICTLDHKWYVSGEDNNPIKVKTKELLSGKYDYILSPQ